LRRGFLASHRNSIGQDPCLWRCARILPSPDRGQNSGKLRCRSRVPLAKLLLECSRQVTSALELLPVFRSPLSDCLACTARLHANAGTAISVPEFWRSPGQDSGLLHLSVGNREAHIGIRTRDVPSPVVALLVVPLLLGMACGLSSTPSCFSTCRSLLISSWPFYQSLLPCRLPS
jgi:hypothetical protein